MSLLCSATKVALYNSILIKQGGNNRKVKVITRYKDNELERNTFVGEVLEITQKRLDEIRNAEKWYNIKMVEVIEDQKETEEKKQNKKGKK